jgi:hypothetical protein
MASRRPCLVARSARRRARQSGARVREPQAQRRAHGRRRARTPPRRLLEREVLRPARRGAPRRPSRRPAQARDLHERIRSLGGRGGTLLQARAGRDPRRPRRDRLRARPAPGPAGRRASRAQRAALDRVAPEDSGLSSPAYRRRPSRPRRPAHSRRLRPLELRSRGRRGIAREPGGGRGGDFRRRGSRAHPGAIQLAGTPLR